MNGALHILFVTGEYPPLQGGVGAYTEQLGLALCEQGATVSVLTSARARTPAGEHSPAKIAVYPVFDHWGVAIWPAVKKWADKLGVNWLHVQYQTAAFGMNPAINLAPWFWRRRTRLAWTYHDLLPPYLFPKAGHTLRTWVTERPAHLCHLPIVTNEGDFQQLAPTAPNVQKIPIGSNIQGAVFTPAERTARRTARGYAENALVVGYFGFLNRSKGGLTLIRTLERLCQAHPDAHLLMIGERVGASDPTNFAYLQEVEALVAERGLLARVQWTGRQDDAEVSADLAACDVLFMPYEDGASLRRGTLMAGLANGCAIVTTTPQAPLPELVDGRDLCYVAPGDAAAAAQAILQIAQDAKLATGLRQQARQRSRLFTWDAIAVRHLELYESIAISF
ncbi:MAG: glycosyltransferase family 4 protein [Caldilineaceae bacterium]